MLNELWWTFAADVADHVTSKSREDMIEPYNAVGSFQALQTAIHNFSHLGHKRLKTFDALTGEKRFEGLSSLPMQFVSLAHSMGT